MSQKKTKAYFALLLIIFAFLYVFFSCIHPLQVFDTDDWTCIAISRDAVPDTTEWNPTRIFPEIFMPVCGAIAAYVVSPIIDNYLLSMTVVSALVVSCVIVMYLYSFGEAMQHISSVDFTQKIAIVLFFFLCHFWIFRNAQENNYHLFFSQDMACIFYYTIPTLLSSIILLNFESTDRAWSKFSYLKRGILILAGYLAVFSNLFCSVVIAVYAAMSLFFSFLKHLRSNRNIRTAFSVFKDNCFFTAIVILWLGSLVLEVSGGRSNEVGNSFSMEQLSSTLEYLRLLLTSVNKLFLFVAGCIFVLAVVFLRSSKLKNDVDKTCFEKMVFYFLCALCTTVFLILLCAVGSLSHYIGRSDVALSFCMYFLLMLSAAVSYVLRKIPKLLELFPLLLCIILFNINTQGSTFAEPNDSRLPPETVSRFSEYIYDQIVEASENGATEVVLHIPKYNDPNNWPHIVYFGERLSNTLYKHGQIEAPMSIVLVMDENINTDFGLPQ